MERQAILDQPDTSLCFILSESARRRNIGDRQIMRDQLRHLVEIAQRPNVEQAASSHCRADRVTQLDRPRGRRDESMIMTTPDFTTAAWRKSSRSGDNGGQCIEVALQDDAVALRDSKATGNGPILMFTNNEWNAFIGSAVHGKFNQQ